MSSQNSHTTMPTLFIGHGSPINALANNDYTQALNILGKNLPQAKAILVISAHWLTRGTFVTSTDTPKIIYDFYGFPQQLFDVKYPALGSQFAAMKINSLMRHTRIQFDNGEWGLDHGAWSVLKHLYPDPKIPMLQMSIDATQPPEYHYNIGQELQALRDEGFLIIGSGNIVHNLRNFARDEDAEVFKWAAEFDAWTKKHLDERNFSPLIHDFASTSAGQMSVPSLEHYLPMLYVLGSSREQDQLSYIYEKIQNGSIAMRSFMFS